MYNPDWEDVDFTEAAKYVDRINRELKDKVFDQITSDDIINGQAPTVVRRHTLPFYAEFDLYEFESARDPSSVRRALVGPEHIYVLNWTNSPIYTVNETAPIHLSEDNAPAYAKFFFNYVKGRHGRFVLVDNASEIAWNGAVPEKGKEAIGKIIQPVTVTEVQDGKIIMMAYMVFKDSLFRAQVHVERDGMVSLSEEALVVEGMPIIEDVVSDD